MQLKQFYNIAAKVTSRKRGYYFWWSIWLIRCIGNSSSGTRCLKTLRTFAADTLCNNYVVISSIRLHFDVLTSKWRRFDVITPLLLCHVFGGLLMGSPSHSDNSRYTTPLQWRHNEHDGVSNHQPQDCLLNLFRRRLKKTSKLRVTGLCEGNSPVTGEFPTQRASNAENVSIWWRHHAY